MKPKLFITTTIPLTFIFFKGQLRLWEEKFDVCAISSELDKLKRFAEEEGIRYRHIPMKREISLFADVVSLFRWIWLLLKERPYIVHGNTPKAALLSMVAAWITRRPVRIYMCHGLRYQGTEGKLRNLLMMMEKITCRCATHVVSVSKGVADVMVQDGLCPKEKMRVVGYGSAGGVDMERFNPDKAECDVRNELKITTDAFVFAFVGRIVKDKGINELVAAFDHINKKYPNAHLLLVGPVETVQNPVDECTFRTIEKNENIHAVGMQNDVRPYLKASDAFILPSYREGFGMVLIEAGAMGLPCITTDITGCNEIIVPGENGAIIEPRNMEALREEMEKWLMNPLDEVSKMVQNARRMVIERYDSEKVRQLYYEEYKKLAKL
jgi:glycosyltransferase involved in cell wall biosynthesis